MKCSNVIVTALCCTLFSCGSTNTTNQNSVKTESSQAETKNVSVKIETSPESYAPIMASTVGIELKTVYSDKSNYKFHWKTSNGRFLQWGAENDFIVKELGKEVTNNGESIYWTYNYEDKIKDAEISLELTDIKTNKVFKQESIKISIDKNGFAHVIKN